MRNSILHRNCREGKDQSGLGRPKRLFKEDVSGLGVKQLMHKVATNYFQRFQKKIPTKNEIRKTQNTIEYPIYEMFALQ